MDPVISARGVNFWFGEGELKKQILFGIDLDILPGEVVLLNGPSGSGKTTLLTLVAALRTLKDGRLRVLGHELLDAPKARQVEVRKRIGVEFQAHNLMPHLTALDNVRLLLELSPQLGPKEGRERASAMLAAVGLGEKLHSYPDKLSGGQRQRVAVARALVNSPSLILADEPTSALDGQSGREVVGLLEKLARERAVPVLMVTHDPRVAGVADRIIKMEDGRIAA
ncbi:MAG: ATP-binding cassette domain-containing protein [Gemmataceae bacterium]|nr:ATP-binding cassette domain-containing protein [Gemmataceae bacterium]